MTDYKFGCTTPPSPPRRMIRQVYTPDNGWMASYEWPADLDPYSQEGANALVTLGHAHQDFVEQLDNDPDYESGHTQPPVQRQLWTEPPVDPTPALEQYQIYGVLNEMDTNSQPGIETTMPTIPAPPVVLFHGFDGESQQVVTPTRFLKDLRCHETMPPQPSSPYRLPVVHPIDPPTRKEEKTPTKLTAGVLKHPLEITNRKPPSTTVVFARIANIFIIDYFRKTGVDEYVPEWKLKKAFNTFVEKMVTENEIYAMFIKPHRIEKLTISNIAMFTSRKSNCTFQFTIETFVSLDLLTCKITETARTKKLAVESFCKTHKFDDFTKNLF